MLKPLHVAGHISAILPPVSAGGAVQKCMVFAKCSTSTSSGTAQTAPGTAQPGAGSSSHKTSGAPATIAAQLDAAVKPNVAPLAWKSVSNK